MFDWFIDPYTRFLAAGHFLALNPVACTAVDLLRAFTLVCFASIGGHWGIQLIVARRLRQRYPLYSGVSHPELYRTYSCAARKIGIRRIPDLHRFVDEQPAAFTLGFFRPAIFLAPRLVERLSPEELEVVLAHELVHVRRYDNLRIWIAGLLPTAGLLIVLQALALDVAFSASFRFGMAHALLVVVSLLGSVLLLHRIGWRRMLFMRELSCDDRTVEALRDPLLVAACLIRVWRLQREMAPHCWRSSWAFVRPFVRAEPGFEYRLRRLVAYQQPSLSARVRRMGMQVVGWGGLLWLIAFLWSFHLAGDVSDTRAHVTVTVSSTGIL